MKKILSILTVLLLTVTLTACKKTESKPERQTVSVAHYVSITDGSKNEQGELVYTKKLVVEDFKINPERVVTYSLGVLDMLDVVGVEKAGIKTLALPKSNLPTTLDTYKNDKYPNAGTLFEPTYDVLDIMNPELIILDGRTTNLYSTLKEKYPNANILDASNTTYNLFNHIEIARNLSKIFPLVKDDIEKEMFDIVHDFTAIKKMTTQAKALFILSNGTNISTSGKTGRYGVLFNEFGFIEADENIGSGGSHGSLTGLEYITKVNPDIIFILDRAATIGNESGLSNLLNEPQFKETNASKNQHVYQLNGPAWYTVTGGFSSTKQMILDIMQYINSLS